MKKTFAIAGIFILVGVLLTGVYFLDKKDANTSTSVPIAPQSNQLTNFSTVSSDERQAATLEDDVQVITTELAPYGYPALTVQKGVPVKWTITASAENLNACNNEITIPDLNITKTLEIGDNLIEFTLTESGVLPYSCWMGMLSGTIAVVDDLANIDEAKIQDQITALPPVAGCCGRGGN